MVLSRRLDCAPDWEGWDIRFREDDEVSGVDQVEHAETAYDYLGSSGLRGMTARPAPADNGTTDTTETSEKEGVKA